MRDPVFLTFLSSIPDGWAEDGKFVVDESLPRGYNVLLFDGPGMGQVIRLQGLPFRHDWEKVRHTGRGSSTDCFPFESSPCDLALIYSFSLTTVALLVN